MALSCPAPLRRRPPKSLRQGGTGIAVMCDHADDAQVAALFAQIAEEQGRLDVLVNNATYIHHQLIEKMPFWEKDLDAARILDVGLRSAYVASWHAARMMVPQGSGVIAFGSSLAVRATCTVRLTARRRRASTSSRMIWSMICAAPG